MQGNDLNTESKADASIKIQRNVNIGVETSY